MESEFRSQGNRQHDSAFNGRALAAQCAVCDSRVQLVPAGGSYGINRLSLPYEGRFAFIAAQKSLPSQNRSKAPGV